MFGRLPNFSSNLFEDFRRLEEGMEELFGRGSWPAGIRSVVPGNYPPLNVGTTPDAVDVYLFAPGVDPKSLEEALSEVLPERAHRMIPLNVEALDVGYREGRG